MKLTGVHLLLTYQCNLECDHCFVWGSPWQRGVMRLREVREILHQAQVAGTVESVYFEGGEPFLYHPVLVEAVRDAARRSFHVGVVTNGYWATDLDDALAWLGPLAGLLDDLSVSSDTFHWDEMLSRQARTVQAAARQLGIPLGVISVAGPEDGAAARVTGQLPPGTSGVMYRGRAAVKLAGRAPGQPWEQFNECPHEDLREPGRVHVDPFGNVQVCQGITIGNLFETPLAELCAGYKPDEHPIAGPLLAGGPAELARRYGLTPRERYADACHLCYQTRLALRPRFAESLGPDGVYGVTG